VPWWTTDDSQEVAESTRRHLDMSRAPIPKRARRASDGVIQFYDTQIPTHTSIATHPELSNSHEAAKQQTVSKECRNETVKPLPPARLLSKQGSRRRSGLVVFPTCSSDYILRPGRGTVSYARSRQLQTSLPWKVGLWSRRVGWVVEPTLRG
jgi:hypothetical protein